MFFEICFLERIIFIFSWRKGLRSFLELQQPLIILADLFCHNDLLAFRFFLNLSEYMLSGVDEDLFEVLHIAFLSLHGPRFKLRGLFFLVEFQLGALFLRGVQGRRYFEFMFFLGVDFDGFLG
jgi:hypothetical protein